MATRLRLARVQRLSGRKSFAHVFGARCSASNGVLVAYAAKNGLAFTRLGLSVGRMIGGAAARNRVKRLLREAFRLEQHHLPKGCDFILIPRPASRVELHHYREALRRVCALAAKRAGLVGTANHTSGG